MSTLTQQLYSQSHWLADGSQTVWNFSFSGGYISRDHVRAYTRGPLEDDPRVDLVITADSFIGDFQLLIEPAVTLDHTLIIYRDTPKDLPLVDFADGANINEVSLDTVARQAVFIAAESADFLGVTTTADLAALAATAIANAGAAAASAANSAASASTASTQAGTAATAATNAAASAASAASSAANMAVAIANAINAVLANLADGTSASNGPGMLGFRANTQYVVGKVGAKLRQTISPDDAPYNAVGDGVADDTADILAAATEAVAADAVFVLSPGKTYKFSQLTLPANLIMRARGATLRSDGSLTTASDVTLTIGANSVIDNLDLSSPGTETNTDILSIGNGTQIGQITLSSDVQRPGGGVTTTGQDVHIGRMVTSKIDRPLHLYNQSVTTATTGAYIGFLYCTDYVRAFRADFCEYTLGGMRVSGRSANASMSPGHNGVLILGCPNSVMGSLYIADAGEHAFRVGGSPGTYTKTENLQIGDIMAVRSGGCAFKLNPTFLASAGVTETCDRIKVGHITGIDIAEGAPAGNKELLRLTHARQVYIASAIAYVEDETTSAEYALRINDCDDIEIGALGGDALNSGFISILGTSDVDGVAQFGDDVTDLRIGHLVGSCAGNNAIGIDTAFNVGRIFIANMDITGFATNVLLWTAGTLTDVFEIAGRVTGAVAPAFSGVPASDNFLVNLRYANKRMAGRGASVRGSVTHEFAAPAFDPADYADGANGVFINNAQGTAGSGNYGGAVEFSRLGSSRRAAAIAAQQGSADDKEVGLAFFVGDVSTTANEALSLAMSLKYTRRIALPTLTAYADNAAAVAGGLAVGDVYWTAAGDIRIVV